jgi:POT family proton-dependent oligopeptide transporter
VSPGWLTLTYLLHTWGELSLSPVGLSAMTRLAPVRIGGLVMGVWFLGTSVGN